MKRPGGLLMAWLILAGAPAQAEEPAPADEPRTAEDWGRVYRRYRWLAASGLPAPLIGVGAGVAAVSGRDECGDMCGLVPIAGGVIGFAVGAVPLSWGTLRQCHALENLGARPGCAGAWLGVTSIGVGLFGLAGGGATVLVVAPALGWFPIVVQLALNEVRWRRVRPDLGSVSLVPVVRAGRVSGAQVGGRF